MDDTPHLRQHERIRNLLNGFFEQEQTADHQNRATWIKKTLSANALFQNPISLLPVDEMTERHEHAKAIQKKLNSGKGTFDLIAIDVAIILTVPLSQLRPNGNLSAATQSRVSLRQNFEHLRDLARHYFTHYTHEEFKKQSAKTSTKASSTKASSKNSASTSGKKGSKKRPYTEDEKDGDYKPREPNRAKETKRAVLARDGNACVFLRTSNPEVAHIIPASWNREARQVEKTLDFMPAIETLMTEKNDSDSWTAANEPLLADYENLGSSDLPWNAICLNHQLHFWFDNRFIGLKFLGSQPINDNPPTSEVDIQFHWMMRDIRKRTRNMHIGTENDKFMDMVETVRTFRDNGYPASLLPSQDGIVGAFNAIDGIPLISGRVIKLRLPSKDVSKLQTALDIQWACVNIASMAGSAGWPDDTSDFDDDERGPMLAREWVLEQSILQQAGPLPLQLTTNRPPRSSSPSKTRQTHHARHDSDGSPTKLSLRVQTRDSSPSKVSQTEQSQTQQQQPQTGGSENVRPKFE
ncbi:hypothetical protein FMEXI_14387 [Fusarium mexicanum]|uniref:HNH nuclease domain-containing protein n=1 Tax=Fusarium mexicanum TaxID=751941 RepID=A0A8H5I4E7_9HYPO|nr:hypothetical protein FMEXI_14387 [Fusarium mexicanum]